jgi:small-conductance mechanosensitive channel
MGLIAYLPRVLISVFILLIGYLISSGIRNIIVSVSDSNNFQHGLTLGQLASGLILAFTLMLGLAQLGLDVTVFANIITLAAAAIFGSAALAFGIGAGDAVRNVMASHYVRKAYRPGQRVRLQELEGEILEMTQVDVIVETQEGEARIPARHFLENVTLIIQEDEHEHA